MKNITIFTFLLLACLIAPDFLVAQTPAQNKETARKILAAVDAGDLNTFSMYISPAMVEHTPQPPGAPKGSNDFETAKMMISGFHTAFPDSKTDIQHIVAEGDLVTIHSVFTGTNTGEFMGGKASNKPVRFEQVDIIRFDAAGKAIEHWAVMDEMTMMRQMGMMPAHKD